MKDFIEFCSKLTKYYELKVQDVMDSNPDSFVIVEMNFSNNDFNFKRIKKDFLPHFNEEEINVIRQKLPKEILIENYSQLKPYFKSYLNDYFSLFLKNVYDIDDIQLLEAISKSSFAWTKERMNHSLSSKIFNIITTLNDHCVLQDQRFSVYPVFTYNRFGETVVNTNRTFNFSKRIFNFDEKKYDAVQSNNIWLDATLGLVFTFKNKPSFYVSFYFDKTGNLFIRQIQGCYKGRGHYVLGDEWEKKVVDFLKSSFSSFSKNTFVLSADSVIHYLQLNYNDSFNIVKPSLLNSIKKYNLFNSNKKHKNYSESIMSFNDSENIKLNDIFNNY